MIYRSRRSRAVIAAALTTALLGLTPSVITGSAQAVDTTRHRLRPPARHGGHSDPRGQGDCSRPWGSTSPSTPDTTTSRSCCTPGPTQPALQESGLTYDVRIGNLLEREARNNQVNAAYAAATLESPLPSGRDSYRTLDDYNDDMRQLATIRPNIAKEFDLPHPSLDGKTVHGIEIGANVQAAEDGRPVFLLMGLHHAREWPSGELAMEFAYDLVKNYGQDARITGLLDRARVIVVPVVNVDGFDLSRTDGGLVDLREADNGGTASILGTPGNAYKRKNCRVIDGQDTPDGTCRAFSATSPGGYGIGIDLNRNYGGFWGGPGASATFRRPDLPRGRPVLRAGDPEHP